MTKIIRTEISDNGQQMVIVFMQDNREVHWIVSSECLLKDLQGTFKGQISGD